MSKRKSCRPSPRINSIGKISRKDAKVLRQFIQAADALEDTPSSPVKMAPNHAVLLGQKIGARLAASVSSVMFREFSGELSADSPATKKWSDALDLLTGALGNMRTDPDVHEALKALEDAHGAALIESEDVTWHAAFQLVMGLKGGVR